MSQNESSFERVDVFAKRRFGAEVKFKDESRFMKLLGVLLFFNPNFMTRFITVIGKTVYFPSRKWLEEREESAARTLCHELVHVADEARVGSLAFRLSYLFPQWLSLFSLTAFAVGPSALVFLVFLAPLPAPFRAFWELRGYAMTDAATWHTSGKFVNIDWLVKQFTSSSYYFMWPFDTHVKKQITESRELIMGGNLHEKISESREILASLAGEDEV
jgi:hypothetical protein